jgi:hypothetical protein
MIRRLLVGLILAVSSVSQAETIQEALLAQAMSSRPTHDLAEMIRDDPTLTISPLPGGQVEYPWHVGIETTVFWCLEPASDHSPSNYRSVYDSLWFQHFRSENPFFVAVPYCDIENGHTKASAAQYVPWFRQRFQADGESVMKDQWVEIRAGGRRCFAQIKDVGPYHTDDAEYVFLNHPPQPHSYNQAALDVSPAVQEYLGLDGLSVTSWRFVDRPSSGPWSIYGELAQLRGGSR